MFLPHQSEIQQYASQNPDNTFKVLRFVQMTIQQNFAHMPVMIEEVNNTGSCKRLTGRQRDAIQVYSERREEIFRTIFGGLSLVDKLLYVASLPGFGIPKAGFVLQCCLGRVGCLDVHNLKRFDKNPKDFLLRNSTSTKATSIDKALRRNRHIAQGYIDLCDVELGCGYLWDSWCLLIADKYPWFYADAEHVSRLHVDCIKNQV